MSISDDCNLFGSDVECEDLGSEPEIPQNKRGRKAKTINFNSNKDIDTSFNLEETVLLTLPISLESISRLNSIYTNEYTKKCTEMKNIKPYNYYSLSKEDKNEEVLEKNEGIIKTFSELTIDGYNSVIVIKDYLPFKIESQTTVTDIRKVLSSKTNVRCWWDCHTFDSHPVTLPISFNRNTQLFKCEGVYCSWNCVISHGKNLGKDTSLVYLLKSVLDKEKKSFVKIKDAPSRYVLDSFGGPVSIEKYRESFSMLTFYSLNVYPIIYTPTEFVETTIDKQKNIITLEDFDEESKNRIKTNKYKDEIRYSSRSEKYLSQNLQKLNINQEKKLNIKKETTQKESYKPSKSNSLLKMIGAVVIDN